MKLFTSAAAYAFLLLAIHGNGNTMTTEASSQPAANNSIALSWLKELVTFDSGTTTNTFNSRAIGGAGLTGSTSCDSCLQRNGLQLTSPQAAVNKAPACKSISESKDISKIPTDAMVDMESFMVRLMTSPEYAERMGKEYPDFAKCMCTVMGEAESLFKKAAEIMPKCNLECTTEDQNASKVAREIAGKARTNMKCGGGGGSSSAASVPSLNTFIAAGAFLLAIIYG